MKTCTICKEEKEYEFFSKRKAMKDGYRSQCKVCDANDVKRNKERHTLSIKNNYQKNKEAILKHKKIYRENNKEKRKQLSVNYRKRQNFLHRERMKVDELYRCRVRVSKLIGIVIRGRKLVKKSKTYEILGCDYSFFKSYIESQFTKGMNWDNIHLDHIKPIASAKTEKEIYELNHYTNFQPLFGKENIQKSDNLITKQLRLL